MQMERHLYKLHFSACHPIVLLLTSLVHGACTFPFSREPTHLTPHIVCLEVSYIMEARSNLYGTVICPCLVMQSTGNFPCLETKCATTGPVQ